VTVSVPVYSRHHPRPSRRVQPVDGQATKNTAATLYRYARQNWSLKTPLLKTLS